MKKALVMLIVLGLAFSCFAGAAAEKPSVEQSPVEAALEKAEAMTWDELLAKAKEEIGDNELVIYGTTSRVQETSFTEYTGIKIRTEQPDDTQIFEKMEAEIGNGIYGADVFVTTDSFNVVNTAFDNGWVENYIPLDCKDAVAEADRDPLVCYYYNRLFIYNNGNGNRTNYISNVWQLTEPSFKGITVKSPLLEKCTMNFLITLTSPQWQEKLASAYRSRYGKDWVGDGTFENISYEWIYRFLENCTFINKDSTIAKDLAKGAEGSVGLFVYSKFRSVDYSSLTVSAYEGIEGFAGMLYPLYIMVASNSRYPYAAALYVNYLMGEYGFMNVFGKDMGAYSANTSISISQGAKDVGDLEIDFWKDCCVVEDAEYIPTVYAQAYTKIAQWCAGK